MPMHGPPKQKVGNTHIVENRTLNNTDLTESPALAATATGLPVAKTGAG